MKNVTVSITEDSSGKACIFAIEHNSSLSLAVIDG